MSKCDSIVEVEWLDSMAFDGWGVRQERVESMDKPDELLHKTSGYLLKSCKEYVAVCHSYRVKGVNIDGVIQIPRRAIRKLSIIRKSVS